MNTTELSLKSDFYVIGGTLRRDAASYVQRQADQHLYDSLHEGKFCYVLTSRQRGKSSLMVRTAARLREDGVNVAVLDLTAIGQNLSAEQWYDGLLSRIGQQLRLEDELEDFWLAHERLGPLQRWMRALTEIVLPNAAGRIVIFVDEIDCVRSLPFSTDEFFAGIREFYNRRTEDPELARLTFCLLGVASPSDLIRDTRTTPFNIGQRIELRDFTAAEAAPLAEGLGRDAKMNEALLKRILHWTGGHPYLTQSMCQAIAEDAAVQDVRGVDRLCEEMFFTAQAKERDDNLLFVRERILRSEADLAGMLELYQRVRSRKKVLYEETNPLIGILRLSGILHLEENHLKVRNRIYETVFDQQWITANMPDAELRRQRAAYRKGFIRAAALALVILSAISALAFTAVKQRNRAESEAHRADTSLQQATLSAQQARTALTEAERQRGMAEQKQSEAEEQRHRAETQTAETEAQKLVAEEQRQAAINQQRIAETQRSLAEQRGKDNRHLYYAASMNLAGNDFDNNRLRGYDLLDSFLDAPKSDDLRSFYWYYLWKQNHEEKATLKGHSESVSSVAFSSDGRTLASASGDRTVKLWDVANHQELSTLKGHGDGVISVAFSSDGRTLASASADDTVKLWDVASRQELATLKGHGNSVWSVAFSSAGRTLASASLDGTVKLYFAATDEEVAAQRRVRQETPKPMAKSEAKH